MRRLLIATLLCLAPPAMAEVADPFEPFNRRVEVLNQQLRRAVLDPMAAAWRSHVPDAVRQGVANVLANLREPLSAASGLAAGELALARNAAIRFGINSSLGLGGVRDVAAAWGHPRQPSSPGDALCAWGVPAGPYLVLPLLGPSNLRDAGALFAANAGLAHGLGMGVYVPWRSSDLLVSYAEAAPGLARAEAEALDPYAVYRSAYAQRRALTCAVDRRDGHPAEDAE